MLLLTTAGVIVAFAGLVADRYDAMFSSVTPVVIKEARAQNTNSGDGNVGAGRDITGEVNNRTVNIGSLNIALEEKVATIEDESKREIAKAVSAVISGLAEDGDLTINSSETELAASIVDKVISTSLTRDVVSERQFSLKPDRAQYLLGGKNRIYFSRFFQDGRDALFYFNGDGIQLKNGGSVKFDHEARSCEVIFDGVNADKVSADMTIFCQ